jgi:hypothetical protein
LLCKRAIARSLGAPPWHQVTLAEEFRALDPRPLGGGAKSLVAKARSSRSKKRLSLLQKRSVFRSMESIHSCRRG